MDTAEGYVPNANAPRGKAPDRYKWNLDPLFPGDAAFDAGLKKLEAQRAALATYKGKLGDPQKLRECLDLYFETRLLTNKATLYGKMKLGRRSWRSTTRRSSRSTPRTRSWRATARSWLARGGAAGEHAIGMAMAALTTP